MPSLAAPAVLLHSLHTQQGVCNRFETPEHGFQVGEHDIGAPQTLAVPVTLVAAQAVDAGMGDEAAFDR